VQDLQVLNGSEFLAQTLSGFILKEKEKRETVQGQIKPNPNSNPRSRVLNKINKAPQKNAQ